MILTQQLMMAVVQLMTVQGYVVVALYWMNVMYVMEIIRHVQTVLVSLMVII
jgi:hypothetical protein